MTEKWVESSRGRTYYWISRRPGAPVIVFLHGLTADHTLFESQLSYFAGKFTVLAWDAPGHGKSRPYRELSYLHAAVELKSILDREGIARCTLVGQSMGGFHAQIFIAHWPERVNGFAAIDSCPFGMEYYSKSDLWWLKQVGWMSGLYPMPLLKHAIARNVARTKYARKNMLTALKPYSRRELCKLMGAGFRCFEGENVDLKISCPAILLVGAHDRTGKVRAYNRAWQEHSKIPLYTIKDAAHNANADNPVRTNRILHAFFNSLPTELEADNLRPQLRNMRAEDWPEVERIYQQALFVGKSTFNTECPAYAEWSKAHLENARFVISAAGSVVGWCALSPVSARKAYAGVAEVSIYMDEAVQGQGYGAVLLEYAVRQSENIGIWSLYAAIFSENAASLRLFEKCGFRKIGTREKIARDRFGNWQDTTLYERRMRAEEDKPRS